MAERNESFFTVIAVVIDIFIRKRTNKDCIFINITAVTVIYTA
jgi:hypothetical protein